MVKQNLGGGKVKPPKERDMIKVYVNGEYYVSFENQEQLDSWIQRQDNDFLMDNAISINYPD